MAEIPWEKVYPGIPDLLEVVGDMGIPAMFYSSRVEPLARGADSCFPEGAFGEVSGLLGIRSAQTQFPCAKQASGRKRHPEFKCPAC